MFRVSDKRLVGDYAFEVRDMGPWQHGAVPDELYPMHFYDGNATLTSKGRCVAVVPEWAARQIEKAIVRGFFAVPLGRAVYSPDGLGYGEREILTDDDMDAEHDAAIAELLDVQTFPDFSRRQAAAIGH